MKAPAPKFAKKQKMPMQGMPMDKKMPMQGKKPNNRSREVMARGYHKMGDMK